MDNTKTLSAFAPATPMIAVIGRRDDAANFGVSFETRPVIGIVVERTDTGLVTHFMHQGTDGRAHIGAPDGSEITYCHSAPWHLSHDPTHDDLLACKGVLECSITGREVSLTVHTEQQKQEQDRGMPEGYGDPKPAQQPEPLKGPRRMVGERRPVDRKAAALEASA
jgi:hypothetical protein